MVTLMWASLDMVTLDSLQVFKDQSLIQIWTASLFTLYHAASLIVLLNMLIAMMSNSYQRVEVCRNASCGVDEFKVEPLRPEPLDKHKTYTYISI